METIRNLLFCLMFVALPALQACSGGDDDDPAKNVSLSENTKNVYLSENTTLKSYDGGEILSYDFSQKNAHTRDGFGAVDIDGTHTTYIYDGYDIVDINFPMYKFISVVEASGVSVSIDSYYFYNDSGDLRLAKTVDYAKTLDYWTNDVDNFSGTFVLPYIFEVGRSWTNSSVRLDYHGDTWVGSETCAIEKTEEVSVPFGNVGAYKINCTSNFTDPDDNNNTLEDPDDNNNTLDILTTTWVHPDIGIIKRIENIQRVKFGLFYASTTRISLTNINWSLE